MIKVVAPRFDLAECRDEREQEFIESLHSRAEARGWYALGWPRDDQIIITVDICDPDRNCVLRMLRVDYDGSVLKVGVDETFQLATDLTLICRGFLAVRLGSPEELTALAADWLEQEMQRPVVRQEWERPGFSHTLWLLADTSEELVWSDSANIGKRPGIGPPDRVRTVWSGLIDPPR